MICTKEPELPMNRALSAPIPAISLGRGHGAGTGAGKMVERGSDPTGDDIVERICATLSEAIAERALRPGTKLPEDVIGGHFGVSRTVVRGALAVLQREHLIERKRNRGAFVAEPGLEEAKALIEARRDLEIVLLDKVLARATPAALRALDALTLEEERIHGGPDVAAKSRLAGRFHVELARLADNPVLLEMLEKVLARISLVTAIYQKSHHDECGADHHRVILAAIARRDREAAIDAMRHHLDDLEGLLHLDEAQGDSHTLTAVLERFSGRG